MSLDVVLIVMRMMASTGFGIVVMMTVAVIATVFVHTEGS